MAATRSGLPDEAGTWGADSNKKARQRQAQLHHTHIMHPRPHPQASTHPTPPHPLAAGDRGAERRDVRKPLCHLLGRGVE